MLHHLSIWVPDIGRAEESWGWLLGQLGYTLDRSFEPVLVFRHDAGFAVALEQSADMVPGMLHSRMRPGLNHLAFRLDSQAVLDAVSAEAGDHGWSPIPSDRHAIAQGSQVAYFEDGDGFEVELVVPAGS
ncbi:MAG: GCN5-related N-acetyltransferase [Acidimicrobiales bacterium]|nr:GCN5-related N-acetyltransferase [Acidimicrobiales bacterium]